MVQSKYKWCVVLSIGLATLGIMWLLVRLDVRMGRAQGVYNPWPLTTDDRSCFAAWSPDSRTVLVNRWGLVVDGGLSDSGGAIRQTLSELWAVDAAGGLDVILSENAVQPVYAPDGQQLVYLAFAGEGRWDVHVLDVDSGQVGVWDDADWRAPPVWIDDKVALVRHGQVWLSENGAASVSAEFPVLPDRARVRLSGVGARVAWGDGAQLWVLSHMDNAPRLLLADARMLDMAWSPDGRRLAYVTVVENISPALWVVDVGSEQSPVMLIQGKAEVFSAPSWSPDGRTLAFSRTPLGAETASSSDIWLVGVDGQNVHPLLQNDLEESDPTWSPDGRYIAFNRAGNVWALDLTRPIFGGNFSQSPNLPISQSPTTQHTPPDTIRVIHREANSHRDVPPGQIDVIPFEDYVKRCVPVEVYASWPSEALKVQAVSARTYAWYYTEVHASQEWDVSDWTDYQAMGQDEQRDPRSDAAVDATQGQYIAYQGDVIKAFYSARNSSPTRGMDEYPYIQAVNDPVSFRDERHGHGWGMSQWGAYRWAAWHGWGYQQILAHYYTGVTIELPATSGPLPLGGVTLPWSDYFVTSNQVHIVANASDETSDVNAVGFYVGTNTTTLFITDTMGSDGWGTVWDASALNGTTTSQAITLSVLVADGTGNVQTRTQPVRIGLDRQLPTETTALIADVYTHSPTITISSLSATDPDPGSGVRAMAFSNEGWTWEGEDLYHELGTGELVPDVDALNGWAWRGMTGVHAAGAWYGPYTSVLPPGYAYRVYFRLKTNDVITTAELALLDVVDSGGTRVLGLRRLRGTDFRAANLYQEFAVDFDYVDAGTADLEFRTFFHATADLYLDRVLVAGYPIDVTASAQWPLTPGEGLKTVTVKFIDGAGNVSADLTRTVTLDTSPPTDWQDFAPEQWDGGPPPTCTVQVRDEGAGLDVDSTRFRFSEDGGVSWSDWLAATCTGISGTNEMETITAPAVAFGLPRTPSNRIQFQVSDVAGLTSTASYVVRGPVSIVGPSIGALEIPYTFTASIDTLAGTIVTPITYTWQATELPVIVHRGGISDEVVFTWTAGPDTAVIPFKTIIVTATNDSGDVGSAAHNFVTQRCVYLPLVMRNWLVQGSLLLP
ncbi:MAG: SpoIID/LytB domain-containing protein [Chloroflexi bacterium]|nr:SpoIID/LytB domain-containing protein [Chloroflexota bacterium]